MQPFRTVFAPLALVLATFATPAGAQGIYVDPRGGDDPARFAPQDRRVELVTHRVRANVSDTVADVRIEQEYANRSDQVLEGTFLFPVPRGAIACGLSLWIDGVETKGEVLDAATAGNVYREIVRRARDPGLLEYAGERLVRASVYPIGARSSVKVALAFAVPTEHVADVELLRVPLGAANDARVATSADVQIACRGALSTVYSPTHAVDVRRESNSAARIGFEGRADGKDLLLYFARGDSPVGLSLIPFRRAGQDGTFALILAPRGSAASTPRDVVFVLDRSGSMQGEKWTQAVAALRFGLSTLRPADRFALLSFATDVEAFQERLLDASPANVRNAGDHLSRLGAAGGTNISGALSSALAKFDGASDGRLRLLVFLTDGLPTVGETDVPRILDAATASARGVSGLRLFSFGVGSDVNTLLLDRLASDQHGVANYVETGENLETRLSGFFSKVADPVLVQPVVEIEGADVFDVVPRPLPDLFAGDQLVVLGRFRGRGAHRVTLSGRAANGPVSFSTTADFDAVQAGNPAIESLWAARRVGVLLNEIRLHGAAQELVDEVMRLGKTYGIVTPYTSALVVEERARLATAAGFAPARKQEDQDRAEKDARDALSRLDSASPSAAPPTGEAAVKEAKALRVLADSGEISDEVGRAAPERVTCAGIDLVRIDSVWIDARFTESMREDAQRIEAFSDAWFELAAAHPELAELLAFSPDVLFVLDGKAVRIYSRAP